MEKKNVKVATGERIQIIGRGGWVYDLIGTENGADIEITNPTDDGGEKFYTFSTVGNPYGAGKMIQERTLGIETDAGRIVGALVVDSTGKIAERFSWSNVVFVKKQTVEIVNGEMLIDGQAKGYLAAAFLADKNRLDGFVGIFKPIKPASVKVLEMEDLILASI